LNISNAVRKNFLIHKGYSYEGCKEGALFAVRSLGCKLFNGGIAGPGLLPRHPGSSALAAQQNSSRTAHQGYS
jgi:hypothetical protein